MQCVRPCHAIITTTPPIITPSPLSLSPPPLTRQAGSSEGARLTTREDHLRGSVHLEAGRCREASCHLLGKICVVAAEEVVSGREVVGEGKRGVGRGREGKRTGKGIKGLLSTNQWCGASIEQEASRKELPCVDEVTSEVTL